MFKKRTVIFLIIILVLVLTSCKAKEDAGSNVDNVEDVVSVDFDVPVQDNVVVPVDNIQDILPMYKNSELVAQVDNDDGGFGVSGFSSDSVLTVASFYDNVLVNAQVMAYESNSESYLNIGTLSGWGYTIKVTACVFDDNDYISNITIAYVPTNLQYAEENPESAIIIKAGLIIPDFYPESVMPIYGETLTEVYMILTVEGTNLLGYSTVENFDKILDYYTEIFKNANKFSTGIKELETYFSGEIDGYLFDVRITKNYEGSYVDEKYKTLVQVFYVLLPEHS